MKNAPEVEAKFWLIEGQRDALAARLGPPARVLRQRDDYFDVPGRVLRIRLENGQYFLTRKDQATVTADGIKSRHEVEYPLPAELIGYLADLLVWLGHGRLLTVEKERLEYDEAGFSICLDRICGLDPSDFVEIESTSGDLAALRDLRDRLGLSTAQVEKRSYAALLAESRPSKAP